MTSPFKSTCAPIYFKKIKVKNSSTTQLILVRMQGTPEGNNISKPNRRYGKLESIIPDSAQGSE